MQMGALSAHRRDGGGARAAIEWSQHMVKMQRFRSSMKRSRGQTRASLGLSIAIGLLLAAVHSDAFNGNGGGGSAATLQSAGGQANASAAPSGAGHAKPAGGPQQAEGAAAGPSINLIPVDQPIISAGAARAPVKPQAESASSHNNNNSNSQQPPPASAHAGHTSGPLAAPSESSSSSLMAEEAAPLAGASGQPPDDEFSEPPAQAHFYTADVQAPEPHFLQVQQQVHLEQQADIRQAEPVVKQQQQQPLLGQSVERRFGLFKKGQQQQQFGTPAMSANYASNPFALSDCERCLASIGQAPSADLQQLDPPVAPPPPPPPASLPLQPPLQPLGGMQPFGPLKSKFFMKFPFLVKPMGFDSGAHSGGFGGPAASAGHFWPPPPQFQQPHHHHQPRPAMTTALYIRPAPSYNCIQANPPLLAAAASSQSQTSEPIPLGATKSGAGGKQYAHQQVSYARR